jgi:uncharacterized protein
MIKYMGKCLLIEDKNKKILVIGDLHLGYEESLNRTGVFVSKEIMKEMASELDEVFNKTGEVDKVVLLGDVKHDFGSIMKQEWRGSNELFEYLEEKCNKIIIVKGNHDKIIEPIAKRRDIEVKDFHIVGEYCFLHGDRDFKDIYEKKIKYWIMGHGHPAVKISDGVKVEKYKCFLVGKYKRKQIIVVPSFLIYNEGSDPRENDLGLAWNFTLNKFDVKVVGEDLEVLEFGQLGKLS